MKRTLLTSLAFAAICMGGAATVPNYAYSYLIDSPLQQDASTHVVITTDGNFVTMSHYGSRETTDGIAFDGENVATGAATTDNSDNRNLLVMKHNASDGKKLWAVSSKQGYIDSADGACAATADGGVVLSLKVRASRTATPYDTPILVDASGAEIEFPDWNTSVWIYNQLLVKVSGNGVIEWVKNIIMDQLPVPNATSGNSVSATTNAVTPNGLAVDAEGNIYVGGNYRAPMILTGENYSTFVLTPRNLDHYNGDVQNAAGGMYLIKFDSSGNYLKHVKSSGEITRDQVSDMVVDGSNLYFYGNVQGDENDVLTVGNKSITLENNLDGIMLGCVSISDMSVNYLTYIKPFGASNGTHTTQCKNMSLINGKLYLMGLVKGGFGPAGSSAAAISTTGTPLEGYAIKCNPDDGSWESAVCNGLSIGGYMGGFAYGDNLYLYGYRMNSATGVILDQYALDGDWTLEERHLLVTGGGSPTCYPCAFNPETTMLYSISRGNNTFTPLGGETSEKPNSWSGFLSAFYFDKEAGVNDVSEDLLSNGLSLRSESGALVATASEDTRLTVVDMKGITLYDRTIPQGETSIALQSGVYIANGVKISVNGK